LSDLVEAAGHLELRSQNSPIDPAPAGSWCGCGLERLQPPQQFIAGPLVLKGGDQGLEVGIVRPPLGSWQCPWSDGLGTAGAQSRAASRATAKVAPPPGSSLGGIRLVSLQRLFSALHRVE
jgi:hypothetical protein